VRILVGFEVEEGKRKKEEGGKRNETHMCLEFVD